MTPRERRALEALAKKDRQALLVLSDLMVDDGDEYAALTLRTVKTIVDALDYMMQWVQRQEWTRNKTAIRELPEWKRSAMWSKGNEPKHSTDNRRFPLPEKFIGTMITHFGCVVRPMTFDVWVMGSGWLNVRWTSLNADRRERKMIDMATRLFEQLEPLRTDFTGAS